MWVAALYSSLREPQHHSDGSSSDRRSLLEGESVWHGKREARSEKKRGRKSQARRQEGRLTSPIDRKVVPSVSVRFKRDEKLARPLALHVGLQYRRFTELARAHSR